MPNQPQIQWLNLILDMIHGTAKQRPVQLIPVLVRYISLGINETHFYYMKSSSSTNNEVNIHQEVKYLQ